MPYSSSLTDREWEIIEPLLPEKKRTRPPKWSKREILNGIQDQLKNGCNWCDLPTDLPPYSTVFWHVHSMASRRGHRDNQGCFADPCTPTGQKKAKWTTLIIIDSQAVKNTCNASVASIMILFLQGY